MEKVNIVEIIWNPQWNRYPSGYPFEGICHHFSANLLHSVIATWKATFMQMKTFLHDHNEICQDKIHFVTSSRLLSDVDT